MCRHVTECKVFPNTNSLSNEYLYKEKIQACVKVASILIYFMLKQLAHFLQNILADYCTNQTRIK